MRPNCDICWVLKIMSEQMEDAEDYSPAEKKMLREDEEMKIAKEIVDHHPKILCEIDRMLAEAKQ